MRIKIKTLEARSHLEVCAMIRMYKCEILDSVIPPGSDFYGSFTIRLRDPGFLDFFTFLPGTEVSIFE